MAAPPPWAMAGFAPNMMHAYAGMPPNPWVLKSPPFFQVLKLCYSTRGPEPFAPRIPNTVLLQQSSATIIISSVVVFNSGRLVVSESSLSIVVRRHKSHCQPSAPAVKSGRAQQKSLWTSRWKRDRKRVTDDDSEQPVRPLFQVYMSNGRINRSFAHFCLIDYLAHTSPGPSAFRFGSKSKKQAPEDDSVCCQRLPFADPMMRTLQGISRTRVESGYVAVLLVVTVENSKSMKWKT
ncbi:hypothetical protein H4Q26_005708 [Puccinia striiformis f. sp. tritici PST-130]|nr:hypothetical protein H4Q26_005708 [Puccinia striiformis f. sp. tritici PST-130]